MSSFSSARDAYLDFREWLFEYALPIWRDVGCDQVDGGFREKLTPTGIGVEAPRRTRVVGRQIFSYSVATSAGWFGGGSAIVSHGLDYLMRHCITRDGLVYSVTEPSGDVVRADFDLYDHAFALFGLAAAASVQPDRRAEIEAVAERMMRAMLDGWSHPIGGFEESNPRILPLKANPHMHIFEACLQWIDVASCSGDTLWDQVADQIAELCLNHFMHPETGAIREYFDADWKPVAGLDGRIIEPGHQFEWGWLLKRWGLLRGRKDALAAARRLVAIAETHGMNTNQGLVVNALLDDFTVKDPESRLWPQTERIKAWVAMADIAESSDIENAAFERVADAIHGLRKYLTTPKPGLWWDKIRVDGTPIEEDCPASSLYHIACAFDVLNTVFFRETTAKPSVFLDRDGVINVDHGYVGSIERVEFVEGATEAIRLFNNCGYQVFVVTNQAGIGHGYYEVDDYYIVRNFIHRSMGQNGARIHAERFCPYHPQAKRGEYQLDHEWRKPKAGMLTDLMSTWPTLTDGSFLIGDKTSDVEAALNAGIPGYLFKGGNLLHFVDNIFHHKSSCQPIEKTNEK